jgi:F-type H+-transporting ATPase subunit delta
MSLARSYAQALYQSSAASGSQGAALDQIETEFDSFLQVADSSKDARIAIFSPVVTAKDKIAIVEAIARKSGFSQAMTNFLSLLARKGRISELREIRDAFKSVRTEAEGGLTGTLESAEPLSADDIQGLSKSFTKKLGKPVAFQATTNPHLLAGIKVTVNGVTYDGTLRAQLQQLRDRLVTG